MAQEAVLKHVLNHLPDLLNRDYLIELLTNPDRMVATPKEIGGGDGVGATIYTVESDAALYEGKLVLIDGYFSRVVSYSRVQNSNKWIVHVEPTGIVDEGGILLSPRTPYTLMPGQIENYKGTDPLETCIGRIIMNYLLLVYPFGDVIEFQNYNWSSDKINAIVSDSLIRNLVTVDQTNVYLNVMFFIGHSPELCSPNLTRKSLTTDPDIKAKKAAIMAKYGDRIKAGDAVAMAAAEAELIAIDRKWLEDDDSRDYLLSGKQFNVIRKKMFLTHGMVESFGTPGEFDFNENSLSEGWTENAFPVIANEVRSGSYSRARETAKGGEESKFILRVFQNTRIVEDDCKTARTFPVRIHKGNSSEYIYRNYRLPDGSFGVVTDENHSHLIGEDVHFRSPLVCESKGGFCFKCMGTLFEKLNQKVLATSVQNLSSQMVVLALKKMHGVVVSTTSIADLNKFVR